MSDEAHLSTEQHRPQAAARVPGTDGNGRRPQHPARTPQPRPEEPERLIVPSGKDGAVAILAKRADFLAANRGRRQPMPGFVLLVRDRQDGDPSKRIGFTVTKKIGGAVVRNRMKRRFRVLARELLPELGIAGADHVLIGRAGGVERDFAQLRAEMVKALRKLAPKDGTPSRTSNKKAEPSREDSPTGLLPTQEHIERGR